MAVHENADEKIYKDRKRTFFVSLQRWRLICSRMGIFSFKENKNNPLTQDKSEAKLQKRETVKIGPADAETVKELVEMKYLTKKKRIRIRTPSQKL